MIFIMILNKFLPISFIKVSHFAIVGGGSKHNLRPKKNIYTISYGSPMEILQLPQRSVKKTLKSPHPNPQVSLTDKVDTEKETVV